MIKLLLLLILFGAGLIIGWCVNQDSGLVVDTGVTYGSDASIVSDKIDQLPPRYIGIRLFNGDFVVGRWMDSHESIFLPTYAEISRVK